MIFYYYWRVRRRISSIVDVSLGMNCHPVMMRPRKGCDFSALLWLASVFHLFFYPEPPPLLVLCIMFIVGPIVVAEKFVVWSEFFLLPRLLSSYPWNTSSLLVVSLSRRFVASEWAQRKFDILNIWGDDVSLFKFVCRILCTITFRHQIVLVGWVKPSMSLQYLERGTWIMLSCSNFNDEAISLGCNYY